MVKDNVINLFEDETIIFCGAGISFNSGLPTVAPLLNYIFEKLGAEKEHIGKYLELKFPFEATMEILNERVGIIELLDVFKIINPNLYHKYIAYLAHKKLVKI